MPKPLVVQKFGGTSVGTAERILRCARRTADLVSAGHRVVVVVSAMGQATDELIALAKQVNARPPERELDMLLATGEQVSTALFTMALEGMGVPAAGFTAHQVGIRTDGVFTKARITGVDAARVEKALAEGKACVVAGFQGVSEDQDVTTLGRGASNITAVALAAVLGAERCEILTDVDGIYTADPRVVPTARRLEKISHEEIMELASMGAQVMQTRTVELAKKHNVRLLVAASFGSGPGTLICQKEPGMEEVVVSGLVLNTDEAKVTVQAVKDEPGMASAIFEELALRHINVDIIVQNVSGATGCTDVTFIVAKTDLSKAVDCVKGLVARGLARGVAADEGIAKLSAVGLGMRTHAGVAARMFKALAQEQINIQMISTSEIKISVIIPGADGQRALKALHRAFELDGPPAGSGKPKKDSKRMKS
ncbi:MAG TPA: aspartate kinase [Planctomycetota bacterium]|nr:aspartate kinase [Planctomycetota bacterium]